MCPSGPFLAEGKPLPGGCLPCPGEQDTGTGSSSPATESLGCLLSALAPGWAFGARESSSSPRQDFPHTAGGTLLAAHHQQEGLGATALLSTRGSAGRLPDASTIRKKSSSIKTSIAHKNQCELLAHGASRAWLPRFLSARAKRELEAPRAQAGAGQPGLLLPVGTDSSSPVQPGARYQSLGSPKAP